jgi:hypothetical protein
MPASLKTTREKRGWQRLPLAVPVFVRGTDREGKEFLEFTTALNVSAGGMLVGLRRDLKRSSRVFLEVPAAPAPGPAAAAESTGRQPSGTRQKSSLGPARNLSARLVRVSEAAGWKLCGFRFVRPLAARRHKRESSFY